jgi:2-polyprenyl-3-methyl-5-hydroxy-6-metoxy-1,4-benzoquinol methylase
MPHRWNKAAQIRREQIENETDVTFCNVFKPYFHSIVNQLSPESILEVGCGTGHLSLSLAMGKRHIVALEPSCGMHEIAKEVLRGSDVTLHQKTIQDFSSDNLFDVIISHMCIQAVQNVDEVLKAASRFLNSSGHFIFSIPHPCFYNRGFKF